MLIFLLLALFCNFLADILERTQCPANTKSPKGIIWSLTSNDQYCHKHVHIVKYYTYLPFTPFSPVLLSHWLTYNLTSYSTSNIFEKLCLSSVHSFFPCLTVPLAHLQSYFILYLFFFKTVPIFCQLHFPLSHCPTGSSTILLHTLQVIPRRHLIPVHFVNQTLTPKSFHKMVPNVHYVA